MDVPSKAVPAIYRVKAVGRAVFVTRDEVLGDLGRAFGNGRTSDPKYSVYSSCSSMFGEGCKMCCKGLALLKLIIFSNSFSTSSKVGSCLINDKNVLALTPSRTHTLTSTFFFFKNCKNES